MLIDGISHIMDIKVVLNVGLILSVVHGQTEIKILEGNRVTPGQTVHIICSLDPNDGTSVVWIRKVGSMQFDLSDSHNRMKPDVETEDRYSISDYGSSTGKLSTQLQIEGIKYEDTAKIGCAPSQLKNKISYATLAICEDTTSTACECIEKVGWMSPSCFEKPVSVSKMEDKYDRTVTGLGVCLGIAVIFGLIMAIIVGWDCMAKAAAKKRKQIEMQQAKIAAKRAGYTGYEESERIDLDPNDSTNNIEHDGLRSGTKSPAAINNYSSMMPNSQIQNIPHTHINRAYLKDSSDKYLEADDAAERSPYRHNYSTGGVPEPAAEIEVHAVDEDLRMRMEYDRSTPEGSVGSAKNNEPFVNAANNSRYNVRSPRYDDYNSNKYPSQMDHTRSNNYQADRMNNYGEPVAKSPGAWSTKSAGLPPGSKDEFAPPSYESRNAYSERPVKGSQGRSGYTEPRNLNFTHGKSDTSAYSDSYEPTGVYIDKSDTVV